MVHWTLPIARRATGWLTDIFHARFRETMLHAAAREALLCPVYCLMPNHIHLTWMGLRYDTDQRNGMSFLRTHLRSALAPHRFQHQPHDHVLSETERHKNAFQKVCSYIFHNPVRAGLTTEPQQWPFTGAIVPGYPTLHPAQIDFWELFWAAYQRLLQPDAGNRSLPPRTVS